MEAECNDFQKVVEFVRKQGSMHGKDTTTYTYAATEDKADEVILQTLDDIVTSASGKPLSTVQSYDSTF